MSRAIGLVGSNWCFEPILVTTSFVERLAGGFPTGHRTGLLIRARSVQGFGLRKELHVVALDGWGRVIAVRSLRPRSLVRVPQASWLLEIPASEPPPSLEDYLRAYAVRARGPAG